jgi:DNA modification methylase
MENTSVLRGNGYVVSRNLSPQLVLVETLKPLGRDSRKHPASQIRKLAESIEQFGFVLPIIVDAADRVVAGWGLVLAARRLKLLEIPAVTIVDLDEARLRSLRLALNRLGEDSSWDPAALSLEFSDILEMDGTIDLQITGFEMGEIDVSLDGAGIEEEDELPTEPNSPVTQVGDLWIAGEHRIFCGDALSRTSYEAVLGADCAEMVFADPPYNVAIAGNVSGLGAAKHDEFAMASGEMSPAEFAKFLQNSFGLVARHSIDGAIHFICMDWRHLEELMGATKTIYSELKNICVWNKSNAGMGSLYRSKHEFIFVFKNGKKPHINNIALGRFGRSRTNVWDYAGQNVLNGTGKSKLALHPTVKPVALVADAIRDCSNRNGIILDPFGGAGTALIAAEKTGRRARLIEIDPGYVDVAVLRWQRLTGRTARNAITGVPFSMTGVTAASSQSVPSSSSGRASS